MIISFDFFSYLVIKFEIIMMILYNFKLYKFEYNEYNIWIKWLNRQKYNNL